MCCKVIIANASYKLRSSLTLVCNYFEIVSKVIEHFQFQFDSLQMYKERYVLREILKE